jgi:hypothetical protein
MICTRMRFILCLFGWSHRPTGSVVNKYGNSKSPFNNFSNFCGVQESYTCLYNYGLLIPQYNDVLTQRIMFYFVVTIIAYHYSQLHPRLHYSPLYRHTVDHTSGLMDNISSCRNMCLQAIVSELDYNCSQTTFVV